MRRRNEAPFTQGTSITATLGRQWEYMADDIIRHNLQLSDEEIVALIKERRGCKSAEWVRSRRALFQAEGETPRD